jgi:hypothetical protein
MATQSLLFLLFATAGAVASRVKRGTRETVTVGLDRPAATATPDDASHPTGCMLGGMRDWQEETRRSRSAVSKQDT